MSETIENHSPQRSSRSKKALLVIAALALITILIIGAVWWMKRPIKPVVLTAHEQRLLNNKVEAIQGHITQGESTGERTYEKGSKIFQLTEREINALFHHNTGLGDKLRFELADNAVHARVSTDFDQDLPVVGGKKLKAKARFIITDENEMPAIILDDLTVWGLSVPNAWLAEMKGQNLLSNLGVDASQSPLGKGIKNIEVTNGKLTIQLAE